MPASGRTRHDVISEFRTSAILAAARKVFATKGFADATMDEIAEASGISKGTVYLYFPSKRDVYLAALMAGIAELRDLTKWNMERAASAPDKIRAFIQTRLEYMEEHRDFFQIYHSEFGNIMHPATLSANFRSIYFEQLEMLERVVQSGMAAGQLRPTSPAVVATAIYEMTRGTILRRLLGHGQASVEEDIQALKEMAWKGIGNS